MRTSASAKLLFFAPAILRLYHGRVREARDAHSAKHQLAVLDAIQLQVVLVSLQALKQHRAPSSFPNPDVLENLVQKGSLVLF